MQVVVVIAEYKRYLAGCGYAAKTIAGYSFYLDKFAAWLTGRGIDDLRKVSRQVILDYQAQVMSEDLAAESKALKIRPVKRLFEHLVAFHKLLINPAEGLIETCRKNRRIGAVLTVKEVNRLLEQPNVSLRIQLRDRAILEVFYSTAIRLNELLLLEIYDAGLCDKVLYVRKAKGRRARVVPLGRAAAAYLKEYLEKIRPRYARKNPKERRLFLNVRGQALTAGCVQSFIRKYGQAAGIQKPVYPHILRRSCATHLLAAGADIRFVQELLGHRRLATTQLYTRIMPADVQQVHRRTHPNSLGQP